MTDAPIALTVHPGGGQPATWRSQLIALWLAAHNVSADQVSADDPITVLTVPFRPPETAGSEPLLIQVIAFSQYYVNADGTKEMNLLTRKPVVFQRTVPLRVPFPTDPPPDGEDRGQTDRQAAQQAPEVEVRDAREAGVSDRHEGPGPQRPGQGGSARVEGAAEEGAGRGDEAVSEPEEDRPQEAGVVR